MLLGCVLRAIFIVYLNTNARKHDPVAVSSFVSVFVAVISFMIWAYLQPETFRAIPWTREVTASLFIYSYFVIAFAQTLNVFAQRRTTAVSSTIIYSLEIVFSIIWGIVMPASLVERAIPTMQQVIGMIFVVAGSIVEIIEFKGKDRQEEREVG